ncbi:hypothetical protein A2316_03675 [Candidatus Falkowbacteria bacterium RIFOXYB2_FULL_38_15]|uniref:Fibronectin type-III domain-containing protein n=1 Tax=Candidatus Falkowbacteria bacterium RIFOXYA2_FULL_38_12 TaxID=1797993 RepID=A0A1F5S3Y0_9BACT|nr:MAG: hypothetical protein A2257_00340 [Candidatus Falkowbacteria bacterium RIFOXYA2_FULL_38_12]OGF32193.1 MAG: hypothetical protein A2316_03675 [Candidatus Falkowbacteria bacterium RIFOXYB2_FULL_38_15]
MFSLTKKLIYLIIFSVVTLGSLIFLKPTNAGLLFEAKDTLSRTATSAAANHEFSFTTTLSTAIIENKTIAITFPSAFAADLGGIDCGDVDLLDDGAQEDINNEAGGCGATATEWGVSVAARVFTLTAPSNAGTYIAGSSAVIIRIGLNTTEEGIGNERITNPAVTGSYFIQIGGNFGDSKTITIYIVSNEQVTVSAEVEEGGVPPGPVVPPPVIPPEEEPEPEEDIIPPVISNIQTINITNSSAEITWETNEGATSVVNYGKNILYGSMATGVAFVLNHTVVLGGLETATAYHFIITSTDAWGNTAISGDQTFTTTNDLIPPANVSNFNATATPARTINLSWTNPADPDFTRVLIKRSFGSHPANPEEGDLVFDGRAENFSDIRFAAADYNRPVYYTAFAYDASLNHSAGALTQATIVVVVEPPCVGDECDEEPEEEPEEPPEEPPCVGDGCPGEPELPPAIEGEIEEIAGEIFGKIDEEKIILGEEKLTINDFSFLAANGAIQLSPNQDNQISILTNKTVLLKIEKEKLTKNSEKLAIIFKNSSYLLSLNSKNFYETSFEIPDEPANLLFSLYVSYEDGTFDKIDGSFSLLNSGFVWEGRGDNKIEGAKVTLFTENPKTIWSGAKFNQENPQYTNKYGEYSFITPKGKYYLVVEKSGYQKKQTEIFEITTNNINQTVELKKEVIVVEEKPIWNEEAPVAENIANVSKNIAEKISEGGEIITEKVLDNPEVEKANENIAAPTVAAVAIISYGTAISFSSLLPFLQFLFTQPLLLLFPKKRKGWGVVYNSLSKMPVDLAIVRLYNKETNKLVQTRVTDREGRFAFFVNPGKYNIAVSKPNFTFPSVYMKDKKEDIQFLDIYHGEELTVNEKDTTITPNIPIDPIESKKTVTDKKIILGYFGKRAQDLVALTGLLVTMASVMISPKPWMFGLLAGHFVLFFVMKRVARAKKPKNWGVVYDKNTKKPVGLTVARIFEKEYNKLLETQVTDANGRYSFLVGNNVYYATFSKPEFKPRKTDDIDLTAKEKGAAVRFNVALERQ